MTDQGKYEDRLPLDGTEVIVFERTGRVMGIYPHWKGIEYATDNALMFIRLDGIGSYITERTGRKPRVPMASGEGK